MSAPTETLTGYSGEVEAVSQKGTGIRVQGIWFNYSNRVEGVPRAAKGDQVTLLADPARWIQRLTIQGARQDPVSTPPPSEDDEFDPPPFDDLPLPASSPAPPSPPLATGRPAHVGTPTGERLRNRQVALECATRFVAASIRAGRQKPDGTEFQSGDVLRLAETWDVWLNYVPTEREVFG